MIHRAILKQIKTSVFWPLEKNAAMGDILAALFHRASATLYFIYVVWAAISTWAGIPALVQTKGTNWQVMFSIAVMIFAAPACFGATFWPNFARLELFAGAAFCSLMTLFVIFSGLNAIYNGGSWASPILLTSILVVPGCRFIIVCIFLLRQAEERRVAAELRRKIYRDASAT